MRAAAIIAVAGAVLIGGCDGSDEPTGPDGATLYEIEVIDETFTIRAEDDSVISALEARLESGEEGVILGTLAEGDGGFNEPWSWHMVAGTIEVPDVATEVCDGKPSLVENNLDYWLNTVQRYCPFSAEVVRRID